METRYAVPTDLDEVMGLYERAIDAMEGTAFDAWWRTDAHPTRATIASHCADAGLIVLTDHGAIIGAACVDDDLGYDLDEAYGPLTWQVEAGPAETCVIHLLVVDPHQRQQGLGRRLLDACIDHGRRRDATCCRLDVISTNLPAIALYEHAGFVTCATGMRDIGVGEPIPFGVMELVL